MAGALDGDSELLLRWYDGDPHALDELLRRHLDWVHERVRGRLGDLLRAAGDSGDFVQDAVLRFLDYAPRRHVRSERHFRGLFARIVENVIRDRHSWIRAGRRQLQRRESLPSDAELAWIGSRGPPAGPGTEAGRREEVATVNLALQFLDADDRRVVVLRDWEGLEHAAIGELLGVSPDAARMRYRRALGRLADLIDLVRRDGLPGLLVGEEGGAP